MWRLLQTGGIISGDCEKKLTCFHLGSSAVLTVVQSGRSQPEDQQEEGRREIAKQ